MGRDQRRDLLAPLAHRQLRRIVDGRHRGPAALQQRLGGAHRLPELSSPWSKGWPSRARRRRPRSRELSAWRSAAGRPRGRSGWESSVVQWADGEGPGWPRMAWMAPRSARFGSRSLPVLIRRSAQGGESGYVSASARPGQGVRHPNPPPRVTRGHHEMTSRHRHATGNADQAPSGRLISARLQVGIPGHVRRSRARSMINNRPFDNRGPGGPILAPSAARPSGASARRVAMGSSGASWVSQALACARWCSSCSSLLRGTPLGRKRPRSDKTVCRRPPRIRSLRSRALPSGFS